jgi:hypothetical protein
VVLASYFVRRHDISANFLCMAWYKLYNALFIDIVFGLPLCVKEVEALLY